MQKTKQLSCSIYHIKQYSLVLLVLFFCVPKLGLAMSVSPSKVVVSNILRNSTQTKTVIIGRDAKDVHNDTTFTVTPRGEFAGYVTGPAEFIMPAGEQSMEYTFDIAPADAANGDYEVFLDVVPKSSNQAGQNAETGYVSVGVSVVSGVTVVIDFTVGGDEMVNFQVDNLQVKDTEVGQSLLASVDVNNIGNVDWKPNSLELTLTAVNDPSNTSTTRIEQADFSVTKAGAKQTVDFATPAPSIAEKYQASAKVYYQDKVVAELNSNNVVIIHSVGTMKQKGELVSLTTNKTEYQPNEKIKVAGKFKNTGEVAVRGVLITEIYQGDAVQDLVRSEEFTIDTSEEIVFPQIIQLANAGIYTVSSYVEFGDKTTAPRTVIFTVNSGMLAWIMSPLGGGIVLGGFIVLLFSGVLLYKYKHRPPKEISANIKKKKQ